MRVFPEPDQPIYVISIAAELAGVHPQTLRVYERKGLLSPKRTQGNSRRYSERDIAILRRIQDLTNEGVNLAGVVKIMALEQEMSLLQGRHERARRHLEETQQRLDEMNSQQSAALVPLKDLRRIRRAMKSDMVDAASRRRTFIGRPISDNKTDG